MREIKLYRGFGRFWHWTQVMLIFLMAWTGFEIHGSFVFFGFENAVSYHNSAGIAFLALTMAGFFWLLVTGEWRQYIPTRRQLGQQIQFYLVGIFRRSPHPWPKTVDARLNPLQRLTYIGLVLILIPLLSVTGILYLLYRFNIGSISGALDLGGLRVIGLLHTAGAWLMLTFLVVHLYLTTTGHTVTSNLHGMMSGREVLPDESAATDETITPSGEREENND